MVAIYLLAIVLANLTVAWFGPWWSVANAFLFIGLDLTARDRLHETWKHRLLAPKMLLLISAGGLISAFLNRDAGKIAVASTVAFLASASIDTIVYHILRTKDYMVRVNGSNLAGAAVDSVVFPWIAFGGFNWVLTIAQFVAKVVGGYVWSWWLRDHFGAEDSREVHGTSGEERWEARKP